MRVGLFSALALIAAVGVPASATTDTSSLAAFVRSCASDSRGCHSLTLNAVLSARSANYGCIPAALGNDTAADRLLDWLKGTANDDPRFRDQPLADLMWTGIDELWPCRH